LHSKNKVSQIALIRLQNFTGHISSTGMAATAAKSTVKATVTRTELPPPSPRQPKKKLAKASFFVARRLRRSLQED